MRLTEVKRIGWWWFMACFSLCEEFVTVSAEILFGSQQAKFTSLWFSFSFFPLFRVIWTLLPGWKFPLGSYNPSHYRQAANTVQSDSKWEDRPKTLRLRSNAGFVIQWSKVLVILYFCFHRSLYNLQGKAWRGSKNQKLAIFPLVSAVGWYLSSRSVDSSIVYVVIAKFLKIDIWVYLVPLIPIYKQNLLIWTSSSREFWWHWFLLNSVRKPSNFLGSL